MWYNYVLCKSRISLKSFDERAGDNKEGWMVERSEYKGKPVLIIRRNEDDKYPFSFGMTKARMILDNLEEIKRFVEENSEEKA